MLFPTMWKAGDVMQKIFIADDEMWIIMGLKKLIEKSGKPFSIIGEANNGVTALEELERKMPDVLFTDIRMPGLNGLELLEKLNEKGYELKVVFITGYADFEYAQTALRLGAFDYLVKPIDQDKLEEVLDRLMEDSGTGDMSMEADVNPTTIQRIIQEIKQNYANDITLTDLARKYGISTSHLSGLIKEELRMSFSEYIAARRVQKAKELLAEERISIEEIAAQVGYSDYFYFTKVFKKNAGISPSKYRKNLLT